MLEVYSLNVEVPADTAIPLNNVVIQKGCTAVNSAPATIQLNKCGVYMVTCDASSSASVTIQLYKNGIAQPQAQSTGASACFVTFVQVPNDNSNCCCSSPTTIQIFNGDTAATFENINVCVSKLC